MTVLVGVRCSDGVVIGSDSVATSAHGQNPLLQLPSNSKIQIFENSVIVAATGAVGFSQRLYHHVAGAIKGGQFKGTSHDCSTGISRRFLNDMQNSLATTHPHHGLGFGALIAASLGDQPCLIEYGTTDFQPEIKEGNLFYVSMGSGQVLADPFLAFVSRVLWKGVMPTVEVGKFGVHWALDHAIKLAPGGVGGPIKVAILRKANGKWVAEEVPDLQEHEQYIFDLEQHIATFVKKGIENADTQVPPQAPA